MRSRWSDRVARNLDGLDALVYTSRIIGLDPALVLWGGGNSSVKVVAKDHLDREIRVLWVKGSGSDMKTITQKQFTPLRLDDLLPLLERDEMNDEELVSYQHRCMLDPSASRPSIETLLHAFLPALHVYHTHADAICTLTDTSDSTKLIHKVYGDKVVLVPYVRPGFRLAKLVAEAYRRNPSVRAIILDKHGLVTWGDTPKVAYSETIKMVSQAESFIRRYAPPMSGRRSRVGSVEDTEKRRRWAASVVPILRGAISQNNRMLTVYDDSPPVLAFVNDERAKFLSQIGPFTPDHLLHTKPKPLFLDLPETNSPHRVAQAVKKAVERYRQEYVKYFERSRPPNVTMLDPYPRVVLVPRVGMFVTGKDRRAARIAHDLYCHTMQVILNASAIDSYTPILPKELCDFEYWPLENYKLKLLPPEKQLSRQIALITGAAGGIGRAIAKRFVEEGASVILTDVNLAGLRALESELNKEGASENVATLPMDIRDERSVSETFRKAILVYGGLDILVSNAGVARSAPVDRLSGRDWSESFAVNATGHFLVCREAMRLFKKQGLGGNIVVISTKNVLAPGSGFGAYSASKAAQAQLARVLAIEGGEIGIRVNMVNPDAVFDGSGLWSKEIRKARAKVYGVPVPQLEDFCAGRNLLKVRVLAQDVAETALFLASDRSSKTTGAVIPVDGGVREAFPR
jgi:rhamnulose-1-phosphate aldolase/alcohol dehydrogenase